MKEKRKTLQPKSKMMAQPIPSKNSGNAERVVGYHRRSIGERMVQDAVIEKYGDATLRISHVAGNMYHVIRVMPSVNGIEYMEAMFNTEGTKELLESFQILDTGDRVRDLVVAIMEIGFTELCYGHCVHYDM